MNTEEDLLSMFWQFTLLSLLAVGGLNTVIPDIQRYVVSEGWMSARQFGEVYALSQATPGPNVMVLTMLGAVLSGWLGALVATIALFLPGTVATAMMIHLNSRNPDTIFALALRRGLAPIAIGLTIATAWVMLSTLAPDWVGVVVAFVTAVICLRTKVNPLWLMAAGAAVGMLDIF